MKADNYPNYLNPHNIDPGRIEPAHIDQAPGFDSIRPGQKTEKLDYLPGISVKPIERVGGDWAQGIQDQAAQYGPFPSDSRLMPYVKQTPTMSNAAAISILENIETDIYGKIAIAKAIDALSGPWVKTSDRLPTEADANKDLCVLAKVANDGTVKEVRFEELPWIEWGGAYYFSHWMKLPEVDG